MCKYMKNVFQVIVLVAALCACQPAEEAAAPARAEVLANAPEGPVVATVNGERVSAPLLEVFARGRGLDPADPAQRQQALDQLIETVLLAQDAHAIGLTDDASVQAEVALAALLQLSGRRINALREAAPIGAAELQAYYQQEVARAGGEEFLLQHILFDNEAAALEAAGKAVQPGADFDALMAEYAAKGALQARELDWANLTQLPAEIGAAAQQLHDGEVRAVPVRTRFGWHVLRRESARAFTPPPLEQVRDGARRQLVERAVAEKVRTLRAAADIDLPGDPPPA